MKGRARLGSLAAAALVLVSESAASLQIIEWEFDVLVTSFSDIAGLFPGISVDDVITGSVKRASGEL